MRLTTLRYGTCSGRTDAPVPGAIRVFGDYSDDSYEVLGWMMPPRFDSRQQPKSLAEKLLERTARRAKVRRLIDPPPRRYNLTFIDTMDGTEVRGPDGRPMGLILPTVSDAAAAGLQSWSKAGSTNSPTRKG